MKGFKSPFRPFWPTAGFNRQERSGIFFLLLLIVLFQVGYFLANSFYSPHEPTVFSENIEVQAGIDALKEKAEIADVPKVYPFNPNFITDYKGYSLGMSVSEIDRLHEFRAQNKFVNTSEDFQKVTQISDSLLRVIAPYFKFPDWTKKSKTIPAKRKDSKFSENAPVSEKKPSTDVVLKDLNSVTANELRAINGIGEVLSKRIVKFRNRLGGFLVKEQVYDVYGLPPEVTKKVLRKYKVFNAPEVAKININTATVEQIAAIVYIRFDLAREIVSYREANGPFSSLNELKNIERFPAEKISRIALYLSL